MKFSVEELSTLKLARDCTAMVRGWLERSGRSDRLAGTPDAGGPPAI
jgi:hypothetical protein